MPDFANERRWIAAARERERARFEAAARRFCDAGALPISRIGVIDEGEFELLLDEVLGAPRGDDGTRSTRTADGRLVVTLAPPADPDAPPAVLETPAGRLRCPDYTLLVRSAGEARDPKPRPARSRAGARG